MGFLRILTWTGAGAGSLLVVISLAAGLYYLAELIEVRTITNTEHSAYVIHAGILGSDQEDYQMGFGVRCSLAHSPRCF